MDPAPQHYKNIGEILIDMGALDPQALHRALALQGRRLGQILIDERLADAALVAQALKIQAAHPAAASHSAVRLPVTLLHSMLHELDLIAEALPSTALRSEEPTRGQRHLDAVRTQLEDLLVAPASELFSHAHAVVAEAAASQGKAVRLEIRGGEFDVDISLLAEFSDVLVHLLRNAVVHGVETAGQRQATGKPAEGVVSVALSCERGAIVLRVADDGAGIDREKVLGKALKNGLLTEAPQGALADDELRRLLFTPGFSVLDKAEALAGRGVGLDVVEAAATRLGGAVTLSSTSGKGTAFQVTVPLSFVRANVLCARIGSQWLTMLASQVKGLAANPAGGTIRFLSSYFAGPDGEAPTSPRSQVHLADHAGDLWAVDEIMGPQRLLLKGVPTYISRNYGIAGTAFLPDTAVSAVHVDLDALRDIKPL